MIKHRDSIGHSDTPGAAKEAQRAKSVMNGTGKSQGNPAPVHSAARSSSLAPVRKDLKFPSGARRADMPESISPAKATLSDRIFSDPGWLFEIKWDGVRAVARVKNNEVCLWSRAQRDITQEYPELARLSENLAGRQVWLD